MFSSFGSQQTGILHLYINQAFVFWSILNAAEKYQMDLTTL